MGIDFLTPFIVISLCYVAAIGVDLSLHKIKLLSLSRIALNSGWCCSVG